MANQFNYELDDRHIKLTMLDATVPINEDAWLKIKNSPINNHQLSLSSGVFQKFEVGISRSVIVPVFFVLLIGGLSALLFSLVDFKKKEPVISEIPLVIPAVLPEKKVQKIAVTTTQIPKKDTMELTIVTDKSVTTNKPENKKKETIAQVVIPKEEVPKKIVEKPVEEKNKIVVAKVIPKKKTDKINTSSKKKKKQIIEEIPVITQEPAILTDTPKEEPEIDIN